MLESSRAYKSAADYKKTHDDLWVSNMSISCLDTVSECNYSHLPVRWQGWGGVSNICKFQYEAFVWTQLLTKPTLEPVLIQASDYYGCSGVEFCSALKYG